VDAFPPEKPEILPNTSSRVKVSDEWQIKWQRKWSEIQLFYID
jgi:hypothetical protein